LSFHLPEDGRTNNIRNVGVLNIELRRMMKSKNNYIHCVTLSPGTFLKLLIFALFCDVLRCADARDLPISHPRVLSDVYEFIV